MANNLILAISFGFKLNSNRNWENTIYSCKRCTPNSSQIYLITYTFSTPRDKPKTVFLNNDPDIIHLMGRGRKVGDYTNDTERPKRR